MGTPHHGKRGSLAYGPRKRASSRQGRWRSYPEDDPKREGAGVRIQGFPGYKAGMTHVFIMDFRETSTTSKQEVAEPATVVEVPPVKVAGVRLYERGDLGLRPLTQVWAPKLDKELRRAVGAKSVSAKDRRLDADPGLPTSKRTGADLAKMDASAVDDVRLVVHTQPWMVRTGGQGKPEVMEIRVTGGDMKSRVEYGVKHLGKELKFTDFSGAGNMVDVTAVTKGKGWTSGIKRWNIKLLTHKNSKHRRQVGTLGPWHPSYVTFRVPQSGQMGYHQRTEFNKRVLKYGEDGAEITPKGGFVRYGTVKNPYVLIHGSIPGPAKRIVRLRDPTRFHRNQGVKVEMTYVSTESKQGK
jgi:large subunit ribosomal protein L3